MHKLSETQQKLLDFARQVKARGLSAGLPAWVAQCEKKGRDVSQWIGISGMAHACSFCVDGAHVSNSGCCPADHPICTKIPGCGIRTVLALADAGLVYNVGPGQWVAY